MIMKVIDDDGVGDDGDDDSYDAAADDGEGQMMVKVR